MSKLAHLLEVVKIHSDLIEIIDNWINLEVTWSFS